MVSLAVQNLVGLIRSHWFIFAFISASLGDHNLFLLLLKIGIGKIIETKCEEIVYLDILPALSKISSHCGYS